jgi:ligand-binding sensor domain-containing protein/signal transduction histidine kinase
MAPRSSLRSSNSCLNGVETLWFLAGLLAMANPVAAIDPDRAMSQYVRERWGAEEGFPRGPVYAITQTTDGYLWIATGAGLVRFDGQNFQLIHDKTGSLVFNSVLGLVADKDDSLWLLLRDLKMIRYRAGEFDDPFQSGERMFQVTVIAQSKEGGLLAAKKQSGAFTFRDGRFVAAARAVGMARSPVLSLAESADGSMWLGTRGSGLYRLAGDKTTRIRQPTSYANRKINCLLPEGVDRLWVGTDSGILRWDGAQLSDTGVPSSLKGFQALTLTRDRDGNIWIGTDSRGLLRFNANGVAALDQPESDSGKAITAVFEDREGNLWNGSVNGIERLRDSAFMTYSAPEGLPPQGEKPVFAGADNRTWFAPASGGLRRLDKGRHEKVVHAELDRDVIYSIDGGPDELWLARQQGGLTHVRLDRGEFRTKTYTHADGLAQDSVYSVFRARDGTVWAGTLSGGVSKLDRGKFSTYTTADGLASNTVAAILESPDGTIWLGTPKGLSNFSKGAWSTFTAKDGLPSANINCLFVDSSGLVWAGTTGGLAFRVGDRFHVPTVKLAGVREQIFGMTEDRFGSFWIATANHVLRVSRDALLKPGTADADFREFGPADGLRGMEGLKRSRSVVADADGQIWFSLNGGISVVDPARLVRGSLPALPHIQDIVADGKDIKIGDKLHIPPRPGRIVIGYAGLSLSVPERVQYRYRLDGLDDRWSEPVVARESGYTNLGPGSYRFRVVACNPDGVWNPREATISFLVEPAFWQAWWFRTGGLLACVLTGFLVFRLRVRTLTERLNIRFEERLGERTRIAQELHDTLLQGFLSASMQVHVVTDRLASDSPLKPTLTRALELMRQVIEEGRNAVRGLRSGLGGPVSLEHVFSGIHEELVQHEVCMDPIDFRVIVEGETRPLHPLMRDEVYRIGREALINSFRHAKARKIEIELNYMRKRLLVIVRDDGCGIEPGELVTGVEGHWGLVGMRERAERISAELRILSRAMGGTEVRLSVPGHIAFQDQAGSTIRRFYDLHWRGVQEPEMEESNGRSGPHSRT